MRATLSICAALLVAVVFWAVAEKRPRRIARPVAPATEPVPRRDRAGASEPASRDRDEEAARPVVRVVEKGSGRPLAGAWVHEYVAEPGWKWREGFFYPGPATMAKHPARTGDDGRAFLPASRDRRRVIVGARGHAWRALTADPAFRLETTVALDPGCQLIVRVPDRDRCREVALVLSRQWRDEAPRLPVTSEDLVYDGLPAGRTALYLRRGWLGPIDMTSRPPIRVVVSSAKVDLESGRAMAVTLKPWIDPAQWVPEVTGQVTLSDGWPALPLEIVVHYPVKSSSFRLTDGYRITRVPVRDGRFRIPGLRAGEYRFEVVPTGHTAVFQVGRHTPPLEITVPPPTTCEVRVLGAPRDAVTVEVSRYDESRPPVHWDGQRQRFRFLVVPGLVDIRAHADGYYAADGKNPPRDEVAGPRPREDDSPSAAAVGHVPARTRGPAVSLHGRRCSHGGRRLGAQRLV